MTKQLIDSTDRSNQNKLLSMFDVTISFCIKRKFEENVINRGNPHKGRVTEDVGLSSVTLLAPLD